MPLDITHKQAQAIVDELRSKLANIDSFQANFHQDPIGCLLLLQGEQRQLNVEQIKIRMREYLQTAKTHIWNRCFNFAINPQNILPLNYHAIHRLIASDEIHIDKVIQISQLMNNQFQRSELLSDALQRLGVTQFSQSMRVSTQTWRERDPVKQVALNLMYLLASMTETAFSLPQTHHRLSQLQDNQQYRCPHTGLSLQIHAVCIVIQLSADSLQLLQHLQPAQ